MRSHHYAGLLQLLKFRLRRAESDARPTFFFHIPKCAGSTLWEVIWDIYGTRHVFVAKSKERHAQLAAMPLEKRLAYSAIGGHGSLRFFRRMLGDMGGYYKIVTLRDPIDRVISEYNYISTRPQHPLNAAVREQSFRDFVERTAPSNRQVKLLADRPDVEAAIAIVERFFDDWAMSDDVERLARSLYAMTRVQPRPIKRKNRATTPFSRRDLDATTLRLLEERNRLDLALIERLNRTRSGNRSASAAAM